MSTLSVKPAWHVDGWSGNYVDDNGVDWVVNQDAGWFEPVDERVFDTEKPAAGGSYSAPNLDAVRVITLTGYARAPDPVAADNARNQFNALCKRGHLHQLVVEEPVVNKTAYVKRAGGSLVNTRPNQFDFQLILTAPDPQKYAADVSTESTGLAQDAPGGIQWNGAAGSTGIQWGGPTGSTGVQYQTGSGVTGVMQLSNEGTGDAPVRFVITGPVNTPSIVNTDTGDTITYGGNVETGQILVVDTGTGEVTLGGADRRSFLTSVGFFLLPPGEITEVAFRSPSPSPTAELAAIWQYAWK
jgi:hypothetical protein